MQDQFSEVSWRWFIFFICQCYVSRADVGITCLVNICCLMKLFFKRMLIIRCFRNRGNEMKVTQQHWGLEWGGPFPSLVIDAPAGRGTDLQLSSTTRAYKVLQSCIIMSKRFLPCCRCQYLQRLLRSVQQLTTLFLVGPLQGIYLQQHFFWCLPYV